MNVVFLMPELVEARCLKRIAALEREGVRPDVLGFQRSYYPGKPWPGGYTILGNLREGQYAKRVPSYLNAFAIIRRCMTKADVVYTFGQDLLGLAWLARLTLGRKPPIVCEVADIQSALTGRGWTSGGLRWLERHAVSRADLLIVTSEAFVSGYYQAIQGICDIPYQVIENKVDEGELAPYEGTTDMQEKDGVLRIGYFGLLRCSRSWEILRRASEKGDGRIHVYLRGLPSWPSMIEEASTSDNVEYGGPYVSPDELANIYERVDMVWAAFPYEGSDVGNWKWARTNRFYESCFFGRPMFTQLGTEDGRVVDSLEIGVNLDLSDIGGSVDQILGIEARDIKRWKGNIDKVPRRVYTYDDEHHVLFQKMKTLLSVVDG